MPARFQRAQRFQDPVDEGGVGVGHALGEAEQGLERRIGLDHLAEGGQLRSLAHLRRYRVHKVGHQARAAVVALHHTHTHTHTHVGLFIIPWDRSIGRFHVSS